MSQIRVAIAGISGRMGSSLYRCLSEYPQLLLTVATSLPTDSNIGKSVKSFLNGDSEVILAADLSEDFDVLIDFTAVSATLANLQFCAKHNKAIVIGTTGFSDDELAEIESYATQIPIFRTFNMSLGVNIMEQLVAIAAKALHQYSDIEIVEAHHKHKVDAPSGTALMIGKAIADAIDINLNDKGVFTRHGITGERENGTIGFSTIRGGDVVGEHSAIYFMAGERLEISHKATDRNIFARGALFAAEYVVKQPAGLYNMSDALNLNKF